MPSATVSRGCCSGFDVAVMPAKFNGGVAGSAITMLNALLVLVPALSRTVTVTLDVPGAVGVPDMAPAADMVRPPGKPVALHASGGTPPVAANDAVYAVPTVPLAADVVVITSGAGAMVTVKDPAAVAPALSLTVAVTVNLPAALGVPLIAPAADAVTPPGSPADRPRVRLHAAGCGQRRRITRAHHAIGQRRRGQRQLGRHDRDAEGGAGLGAGGIGDSHAEGERSLCARRSADGAGGRRLKPSGNPLPE